MDKDVPKKNKYKIPKACVVKLQLGWVFSAEDTAYYYQTLINVLAWATVHMPDKQYLKLKNDEDRKKSTGRPVEIQ